MRNRKNNSIRTSMFETLEFRRLMSVSLTIGNTSVIYADYNSITVNGTNSADTISVVQSGNKITITGASPSPVSFDSANVKDITVNGYDGNDNITVDAAVFARVYGDAGNDTVTVLRGGRSPSYLETRQNDLRGSDGDDILNGGSLADEMHGGNGNDIMRGNGGTDILWGDVGNDQLFGGDGNDNLIGSAGTDYMYGDAGDDLLQSHGDNYTRDYCYGGDGFDKCYYSTAGFKGWTYSFGDVLSSIENKVAV